MALIYRVIEDFDPYSVPNANYVIGCADYAVVYKTAPGKGKTKTLAIAYLDSSGTWIVGAEPEIMSTLPYPKQTLDDVVNSDRSMWETWECITDNPEIPMIVACNIQLGFVPIGVWKAFDKSNGKLPGEYLPFDLSGNVTAIKPRAKYSLGDFDSNNISSTWKGDPNTFPIFSSTFRIHK